MTHRDRILDDIEQRIIAARIASEVEVMPSTDPDMGAGAAVHIYDHGEARIESEAGTDRMRMAITLEGFVQGEGKIGHRKLNALRAAAVLALFDGHRTGEVLSGLAEEIELGDFNPTVAVLANKRTLAFVQEFFVTFATRRGDPATAA